MRLALLSLFFLGCGPQTVNAIELRRGASADAAVPGDMGDAGCPGVGRALSFDGLTARVEVDLGGTLPTGNTARTVEAWVYTRPTSWALDRHTIFEYGTNITRQAFAIDPDPFPTMQFYTWNDDLFVDTGFTPEQSEGWFHVAGTYDGTTLRGYINGLEKRSRTFVEPLTTTQTVVNIGRSIHTMAYFDGIIDEVRIWNLARTPEQIAGAMYTRLTGNEEGLVAYYHFDEGAGTTAHDASDRHHDATLIAGPAWVPSPVALTCPSGQ
jgi:Concanavalin A-like lectin/glucanases superfamily